jgi:prolyl oligopeptidase
MCKRDEPWYGTAVRSTSILSPSLASLLPFLLLGACGGEAPVAQAPAPAPVPPPATAPTPMPAPSVPPQVCGVPPARTVDVTETKFGITLSDPYRWMEGNDNAELTGWLRAQGECTQRVVGHVSGREPLFKRLRDLGLGTSGMHAMHVAGGRAFFQEVDAGEQLPKLVVREANGQQRVLVDPSKLGQGEKHASVNEFTPSPDGKLVAYDLALGGGEVSSIHVMDVAKGTDLPDVIDRVWGEFGVSWLMDGKSFFYTQMAPSKPDADPVQNMQARYHVLGQPMANDVPIIGDGAKANIPVAPEEFPSVVVQPGSRWAFAIFGGAHSELRMAIAPLAKVDRTGAGKTPWRMVAEYADQVEGGAEHGDRLYLQTFKGASNRKIVSVPLADPDLSKAKVELPEAPDATVAAVSGARDALYVKTMVVGRAHLIRMPWGKAPVQVALPYDGWIDDLATDPLRDGARYDIQGWTRPAAYYDVDVAKGASKATGITTKTTADFSNIVADEVEAKSSDGTMVPLSILHPKDLPLDGSRPAVLYGYGGYGIPTTPSFSPSRLAWLELGTSSAICHVRGGGELGRHWQDDGSHERKMNGVHDFEACAQYLVDHKVTSPNHLAARGGSAGGILIGRAITDRPDLFVAANIAVGMVNPTRLLFAENGANQKVELGDPETEGGFKALYEMDPSLHVASAAYPAVIFTVGLNDKRVAPWMTAKLAARMQTASTSGRPIVVRIDADTGHGIGSMRDQVYAEQADVYSFMLAASGDPGFRL